MSRSALSRRRAVGTALGALALPLLPELDARAAIGSFPKRLIIFSVPEGVEKSAWWGSARSSTDFDLGPSLAPLAPFKGDITLVRGVCNKSGFHNDGVVDMLTGGIDSPSLSAGGRTYPGGISVDQMVAQQIGAGTRIRSYQVGVMAVTDKNAPGTLSYESASVRRRVQNNPVQAFADLIGGGVSADPAVARARRERLALRKSTLDSVLPALTRLRCALGAEGRAKLDVHEGAIRSLEKQIDAAMSATGTAGTVTAPPATAAPASFHMANGNYPAVTKMQLDLIVAALSTDVTRVMGVQFNKSVGRVRHSWLPLNFKDAVWHELSHANVAGLDKSKAISDRAAVSRWYAEQVAYLLKALKSVPEGNGTMLDNTLVLHVSEMGEGNHSSNDIPILLAGRGGGAFRTGLHLDARQNNRQRFNNDILAAVARGFGVPVDHFGVPNRSANNRFSEGIFRPLLV